MNTDAKKLKNSPKGQSRSSLDNKVIVVRGYQCFNLHVIDATEELFCVKDLAGRFQDLAQCCVSQLCFSRETTKTVL